MKTLVKHQSIRCMDIYLVIFTVDVIQQLYVEFVEIELSKLMNENNVMQGCIVMIGMEVMVQAVLSVDLSVIQMGIELLNVENVRPVLLTLRSDSVRLAVNCLPVEME